MHVCAWAADAIEDLSAKVERIADTIENLSKKTVDDPLDKAIALQCRFGEAIRMENAMLVFVSPSFGTSNERSEIATLIRLLLCGWGECYMHLLMRIDL